MVVARALGKRVVLHYHSGAVVDHLAHWGLRVHPWLRVADTIVVCTEFQRAAFARFGHAARVIANVMDTSRFRFRDRVPLAPRFVCTRNFEPHYRVDAVIDAFVAIRHAVPGATLVLAGDGSLAPALRAQAARAGHEGIAFVGATAPADMPALLDQADIFLNASVVDNQPLSLIEAAAAGLPIVTTATGGIGEMVEHGRTGLLVQEPEPRALAHAALSLIARPDWARQLARDAHAGLGRYAWSAVRGAWASAYGAGADEEQTAVRKGSEAPPSDLAASRQHA
jgi:glycosyltransferase involved in cell wall biosynthesis